MRRLREELEVRPQRERRDREHRHAGRQPRDRGDRGLAAAVPGCDEDEDRREVERPRRFQIEHPRDEHTEAERAPPRLHAREPERRRAAEQQERLRPAPVGPRVVVGEIEEKEQEPAARAAKAHPPAEDREREGDRRDARAEARQLEDRDPSSEQLEGQRVNGEHRRTVRELVAHLTGRAVVRRLATQQRRGDRSDAGFDVILEGRRGDVAPEQRQVRERGHRDDRVFGAQRQRRGATSPEPGQASGWRAVIPHVHVP